MKIPPFGKPLQVLLQSGQIPNNSVYLYIGNLAWDKGRSSSISRSTRTLILPFGHNPLEYDWPVNGCDILMIETSQIDTEFIESFADLLLIEGATKVTLISINLLSTIYKKDF
jgi:hypothetical protein